MVPPFPEGFGHSFNFSSLSSFQMFERALPLGDARALLLISRAALSVLHTTRPNACPGTEGARRFSLANGAGVFIPQPSRSGLIEELPRPHLRRLLLWRVVRASCFSRVNAVSQWSEAIAGPLPAPVVLTKIAPPRLIQAPALVRPAIEDSDASGSILQNSGGGQPPRAASGMLWKRRRP